MVNVSFFVTKRPKQITFESSQKQGKHIFSYPGIKKKNYEKMNRLEFERS